MRSAALLLALAGTLSACNDAVTPIEPERVPTGPCAVEGACEVRGVDLVLMPPEIIGTEMDPVTGRPLLFPGDTLRVRYHVRNRGDKSSAPTSVQVCVECGFPGFGDSIRAIPTLEPGRADSGVVNYVLPANHSRDTVSARLTLDWTRLEDDPLYANDAAETPVYFAVPLPEILVEVPGGEMRTAEPKQIRVRIENKSRFTALSSRTLHHCFAHYDIACPPFEFRPIPDVPPGSVLDTMITITAPHDAWIPGYTEPLELSLVACVGDVFYFPDCGGDAGWTVLLPNLDDFCSAPVIPADTLVRGVTDTTDCALYNVGNADVWSIDLEQGVNLSATLTSTTGESPRLIARSWRGDLMAEGSAEVSFTATDAMRYHVIVEGAGTYSLTLTGE